MKLIKNLVVLAGLLGFSALLQAQELCIASIHAATPTADFTDNGNGTVTHNRTGLMWKRCSEGQTWSGATCTGSASTATWANALKSAVSATAGGYSDWRLPNVKELRSIVEETCRNPSINTSIFPNTSASDFWSASAGANYSDSAWYVDFVHGYAYGHYKSYAAQVRLVRSGQSSASFDSLAVASSLNVAPGWNLLGNSRSQPLPMAPAFSDQTLVNTVWKWDVSRSAWQLFAPSMDATALQAYATAKGYGVLSVINPGEGFWVNAKRAGALGNLSGAAFGLTAAALQPGWNLVATGNNVSPSAFNRSLSTPPSAAGTIPLNLISLWAWDNALSKWYFYAPALEASGTLSAYTASKGYLDFAATGKTLGDGQGFWVNYAGGSGVASYTIGGTVTGLSGSMVLQNNGGDNYTVSVNGNFTFPTAVTYGNTYNVTVLGQPTGQICSITGGSGTATGNVSSVVVQCANTSSCPNIAGSWHYASSGSVTCAAPSVGYSETQPVSGSGTATITQSGCNVSWGVPGTTYSRSGAVGANNSIQVTGIFAVPLTSDLTIAQNSYSASGTVSADTKTISLNGQGSATGDYQGIPGTCTGVDTATFTR